MKKNILKDCWLIASKHVKKHPQWDCYKHYSFIIQDNSIIEWGTNRAADPLLYFGYPKYGKLHAECDAYVNARGLMAKNEPFSVVNIRLSKSANLLMSKPCEHCARFLHRLGCREVWFTTKIGFAKLHL